MRVTYDSDANAAYLEVKHDIGEGSAVEDLVIERPDQGEIVLDFDVDGQLLGVEILGAAELLHSTVLDDADRI